MADEPVEKLLYDFLVEQIAVLEADLDPDDPSLFIDLHRHPYQDHDDKKWFGIRLGNCASTLAPNPGATEMLEFDADLPLITFAQVQKSDHSDLETAVNKAFELAKWLARQFLSADGVTLSARVNDARVVDKCPRDFREWKGSLYAVCAVPMLINDTGANR